MWGVAGGGRDLVAMVHAGSHPLNLEAHHPFLLLGLTVGEGNWAVMQSPHTTFTICLSPR